MRALVAMSGGVDSSVAAALMLERGHEVVGATMKLWGGPSDSGCCSVADVEDARRVAQQLGIDHHVFNFTADFERHVVGPYVGAHAEGRTPNPCIACNAHLKFDRFLERAEVLGFDVIVTGHHARVRADSQEGTTTWELRRGKDIAKDQSYVLYMLGQHQLARLVLPVGEMTKDEVRRLATSYGLRTAAKPDSQDVCFISKHGGREAFLGARVPLGPGRLVDTLGTEVGTVDALELVTVGQRRGLGFVPRSRPERRFVLEVDLKERTATVGRLEELMVERVAVGPMQWARGRPPEPSRSLLAQFSAHGQAVAATWGPASGDHPAALGGTVVLGQPVRRVAPGQAVVLYEAGPQGADVVVGGGTAI